MRKSPQSSGKFESICTNSHKNESGRDEFLSTDAELGDVRAEVVSFIRRRVRNTGADGVVVALSGGVDSTLTAFLTAAALGSDDVLGLGLPCNVLDGHHMQDARTIADGLGIDYREIDLQPLRDMFEDVVVPTISTQTDRRAVGNAVARLRMVCAYYAANTQSRLVVGTANRSERLLGYFTKYGDGAADLYPLGELYKTEVRALAQHVGVPKRIIYKAPTAGFWAGQTDEDDLGAPYDVLDRVLHSVLVRDESVESAADAVGVDPSLVVEFVEAYARSRHKRAVPPTPSIRSREHDLPDSLDHLVD